HDDRHRLSGDARHVDLEERASQVLGAAGRRLFGRCDCGCFEHEDLSAFVARTAAHIWSNYQKLHAPRQTARSLIAVSLITDLLALATVTEIRGVADAA